MPEDKYSKQLFSPEVNVKPRRGRQRKTILLSIGLDKHELLEDIEREDSLVYVMYRELYLVHQQHGP